MAIIVYLVVVSILSVGVYIAFRNYVPLSIKPVYIWVGIVGLTFVYSETWVKPGAFTPAAFMWIDMGLNPTEAQTLDFMSLPGFVFVMWLASLVFSGRSAQRRRDEPTEE